MKIKQYLNERKPVAKDFTIKDYAMELTSELEVIIKNHIANYFDDDLRDLNSSDRMKLLNLAVKKMKVKNMV